MKERYNEAMIKWDRCSIALQHIMAESDDGTSDIMETLVGGSDMEWFTVRLLPVDSLVRNQSNERAV